MTIDEKRFQVNGSLVGLYNPSAPAINPTGRLLFISGTPSEIGPVPFFLAMVTNGCVLDVWAHLPATPSWLTRDQQSELVHFVEL